MPYSQSTHNPPVASFLSMLSSSRMHADNFLIPFYSKMEMPIADLSGKLVIITGSNSGIGLETARAFAGMGARVILACRNEARVEEAKKQIIQSTGNLKVEVELLDCGSFASVHILVNNAGGNTAALTLTEDGYEQTYQTNHLSHVLLTHSLLNAGCIAPNGRIISVSSVGYYSSDPLNKNNIDNHDILTKFDNKTGTKLPLADMMQLYFRSKAAQAVWSMALQRRLSEIEGWKGITVHSCHPGTVKTAIWSQPNGAGAMTDMASSLFKLAARTLGISSEEGAVTSVWLAVAPEPASPGMEGLFWDRMQWKWVKPWSLDVTLQDGLWDVWCKETGAPLY
ncbi:short chain dehydrogenase [Rhizoctonia solani]|uniref:Short chain dehydrogenase n=1 Tax=Rhizoctonia solani TaxID=456999 RepID=A0A8H8NP19_9AGAM|nr:short chain dehydrogenase [Rhizoctonia solani]QRW16700.1 short chain dehydrogenase [Rhizoctonia solani]